MNGLYGMADMAAMVGPTQTECYQCGRTWSKCGRPQLSGKAVLLGAECFRRLTHRILMDWRQS